jgi:hypothetical protein
MNRDEWLEQAALWERKAQNAYDLGDETLGDYCQRKAQSCRVAADYAPEREANSDTK